MRETCDDNPLLADCPYANTGENLPAPPDEREPIPDDEPQYLTAARNVLGAYCGPCHGTRLTEDQASAAINYIDDWDRLMQAGLIEACSPGRSRIIQVMRTGEMPPPNSGFLPVVRQDIDVVTRAIELDCR